MVLESLEKPGNLGAILRTCDGVGVEAVFVCDPKTDVYNPNVIRSSTGVVFKVPVVCATPEEIFSFLKSGKLKFAPPQPSASKLYTQVNFKGAWALVFGSEDQGLSDFWLGTCGYDSQNSHERPGRLFECVYFSRDHPLRSPPAKAGLKHAITSIFIT